MPRNLKQDAIAHLEAAIADIEQVFDTWPLDSQDSEYRRMNRALMFLQQAKGLLETQSWV